MWVRFPLGAPKEIMEALLKREVTISPREVSLLEYLLATNGFKNFSVCIQANGNTAIVTFDDESEYTYFILKDILGKVKKESGYYLIESDFDFMIKLEKKLKSYNKFDEVVIRKLLKGR